jgi:hypothetical protein
MRQEFSVKISELPTPVWQATRREEVGMNQTSRQTEGVTSDEQVAMRVVQKICHNSLVLLLHLNCRSIPINI